MATSENTSTEDLNMSNQTTQAGGGMGNGNPLAPAEGYEYDFSSDSETPQTPFDPLIGVGDIDDLGDIFGDLDPEDNPFGGNPTEGGGNSFGGGNSDGFGGGMDDMDEDSEVPVDSDDDAPMPVELPSMAGTQTASAVEIPSVAGTQTASAVEIPSVAGTQTASAVEIPSAAGTQTASAVEIPSAAGTQAAAVALVATPPTVAVTSIQAKITKI